jgi:large conductance mechanosensitive channel
MLKEFRDFAMRGNVVDLAVGVIIGAAFGKIVTALVDKILMPIIGGLTAGIDFSKLQFVIPNPNPAGEPIPVVYGELITTTIQFIIVAWALFLLIKAMNSVKRKEAAAPPPPPAEDILLLREIRDALKK